MTGARKLILVSDRMQTDYGYSLTAAEGEDFAADFLPHFSPSEMFSDRRSTFVFLHLLARESPRYSP